MRVCACGCGLEKKGRGYYRPGHLPADLIPQRGVICACGCGEPIPPPRSKTARYHPTRFIVGHQRRVMPPPHVYIPKPEEIPSGLCECGCGIQTPIAERTYRYKRYFRGHPMPFYPSHHARRSPDKKRKVTAGLSLSPAEAAYLAAIVDGEGTVYLRGGRSVRLSVTNTCEALIDWLTDKVGGSYHIHKNPDHPNRLTCWRWGIEQRADVLSVLRLVEPHMIVKRAAAQKAITLLEGIV